jgi:hypothetical protein
MTTIYIVQLDDDPEGPAAFEHEDQAERYAEARGAMYLDVQLCDRKTGERMIVEAERDD